MNKYEVWSEGFRRSYWSGTAQRVYHHDSGKDMWEGKTFEDACEHALIACDWDMSYYDSEKNTFWSCKFFDNETDARKSYG